MLGRGLWVPRPHSTSVFFPVPVIPSVSSKLWPMAPFYQANCHTSHTLTGPPPYTCTTIVVGDG